MDLLQYLVSPSKSTDSSQPAAAHSKNTRDTSVCDDGGDALDALVVILENTSAEVSHDKLDGQADDLEEGEVVGSQSSTLASNQCKKICFFAYHNIPCQRQAEGKCTNSHTVPEDAGSYRIHRLPTYASRKIHQEPCGLPLCRWKDGRPPRSQARKIAPLPDQARRQAKPVLRAIGERSAEPTTKKRKRITHRDEPTGQGARNMTLSYDDLDEELNQEPVTKRTRVDYSDFYPSSPPIAATQVARASSCVPVSQTAMVTGATCFFWLHGKCRRQTCSMKHALEDPPKMVEPPPGYVHHRPCGLKWCAGDGQAKKDRSKGDRARRQQPEWYFEGSRKTSDDDAEGVTPELVKAGEQEPWFLEGFE
ncbi:hypothetical protein B0A48_02417 [Cryoendolithus antarcticus]|uniref:C3H1-type domain-containing protein n=1 Tax=Cryoendolithus antarcticus TaxID=1507870 RepID=A0A1V8TNJ5_9PEZI|nr:hypothetical protein B0A48_02417 [Cryoendolithus antarcticus]